MTLFAYIDKNIDRIKYDVRIGIVPCCLIKHYQIYSRYYYYRLSGKSVSLSVFYVSEDFETSERWVFELIRKMESEI